jgi:hypothetical protein
MSEQERLADHRMYLCESCGKDFKSKTALLSHQRNTHAELRPSLDASMENALLKMIAPNGVPPDSALIREVWAFLETAEQLRQRLSRQPKQSEPPKLSSVPPETEDWLDVE